MGEGGGGGGAGEGGGGGGVGEGGGGGGAGDGGGGTLETPSAVMRTRLPSNFSSVNELSADLRAYSCSLLCKY